MSLMVIKSDGSSEAYIHTRVMATISAAISDAGCYNEQTVSALADAVRMYIEDCKDDTSASLNITSDEIYCMILATLQETGCAKAAVLLKEHRVNRQISRKRQMVIHCMKPHLSNDEQIKIESECCLDKSVYDCQNDECEFLTIDPWNKSRLSSKLKTQYNLTKNAARVVAANVEDKIFKLKISTVRSSLIQQLILNELFLFRNASDFIEKKTKANTTETLPINELNYKQPTSSNYTPNSHSDI